MCCVANQKGGVGKTTVTVNLAAAVAAAGGRVLVVDVDPQGNATVALDREELYASTGAGADLAGALRRPGRYGIAELVDIGVWTPPAGPGRLDLLPSCEAMFLLEAGLAGERAREWRLNRLLDPQVLVDHYDVVLIDCPPSLGTLTDNALLATGEVIVVAAAEPSSRHGLQLLLDQVRGLEAAVGVDVAVAGIVANRVEATRVARDTLDRFAELGVATIGVVPKRVRLQEAWDLRVPVQALPDPGDLPAIFTALAATLAFDQEHPYQELRP